MNWQKKLEEQKIGVTIIEPDREKTQQAATVLDKTIVLQGSALDIDLLKEASIDIADFFVALSESEQSNILSALLAKDSVQRKQSYLR